MNKIYEEKAVEVLKEVLHMLHEKKFEEVTSCVDESEIDDLGDFLLEFMQGTLELNDFDRIDEYGVECSFKPNYEYCQLDICEYDDGNGFLLEYEMTSNGELVDMVLQLDFLYVDDNKLKCIFKNVDPQ